MALSFGFDDLNAVLMGMPAPKVTAADIRWDPVQAARILVAMGKRDLALKVLAGATDSN